MSRSQTLIVKTQVESRGGVVAAMHPLATQAGIEVLKRGGNAIDAAVAVGFAIGVVEPFNSGLGAIAVLVYYDAGKGQTVAIDGTGPLPRAIRPELFTLLEPTARSGTYQWRAVKDDANNTGHLAVAVPGTPACLCEAHSRFGKLPLAEVIAPAIRLAAEGFELDWYVAYIIATQTERLWKFPDSRRIFFRPSGAPLRAASMTERADRLIQSDLAETLRRIAQQGPAGFYRGEVARRIAEDMAANGGVLTEEDLASYRVRVFEPAMMNNYRGFQIIHSPVTNGGPTVVEALNIVENVNLAKLNHNSAPALHLIIEAQRRAFLDRFRYLADPDFAPVPINGILSKDYGAVRFAEIDPERATPEAGIGKPWAFEPAANDGGVTGRPGGPDGHTTHFTVVDGDHNMASVTSTLGGHFGSAVVPPGTGVMLNNGGMWFDPEPGSLVSIGPNKRIMTAGTPTLVLRDGKPHLAIGAPGGRRVISAIFQCLLNVLDYGLGIQDAISAPRVHCEGHLVEVDSRLPDDVIDDLRRRGHDIVVREETPALSYFARPNGVAIDARAHVLRGGVTPFGPATAIGQ